MTAIEIQDYIHVYSMFTFRDGSHVPGIVINKYNVSTMQVDYYFIEHADMQSYKTAFEKYDRETCMSLSRKLEINDVMRIRPVSLSDYKIIMQLLDEQRSLMNAASKNSGRAE
jgi:hypothetical protein